MTAHGSEEIASLALRKGAASYVPKAYLEDIIPTLTRILDLSPGTAVLALENAAGHSGVIGRQFSELGQLVHSVRSSRSSPELSSSGRFSRGAGRPSPWVPWSGLWLRWLPP